MHAEDERLCAQEAIRVAAEGMTPDFFAARDLVLAAIGVRSLSAWNDEKGRTAAQVLAAFDKAIAMDSR